MNFRSQFLPQSVAISINQNAFNANPSVYALDGSHGGRTNISSINNNNNNNIWINRDTEEIGNIINPSTYLNYDQQDSLQIPTRKESHLLASGLQTSSKIAPHFQNEFSEGFEYQGTRSLFNMKYKKPSNPLRQWIGSNIPAQSNTSEYPSEITPTQPIQQQQQQYMPYNNPQVVVPPLVESQFVFDQFQHQIPQQQLPQPMLPQQQLPHPLLAQQQIPHHQQQQSLQFTPQKIRQHQSMIQDENQYTQVSSGWKTYQQQQQQHQLQGSSGYTKIEPIRVQYLEQIPQQQFPIPFEQRVNNHQQAPYYRPKSAMKFERTPHGEFDIPETYSMHLRSSGQKKVLSSERRPVYSSKLLYGEDIRNRTGTNPRTAGSAAVSYFAHDNYQPSRLY